VAANTGNPADITQVLKALQTQLLSFSTGISRAVASMDRQADASNRGAESFSHLFSLLNSISLVDDNILLSRSTRDVSKALNEMGSTVRRWSKDFSTREGSDWRKSTVRGSSDRDSVGRFRGRGSGTGADFRRGKSNVRLTRGEMYVALFGTGGGGSGGGPGGPSGGAGSDYMSQQEGEFDTEFSGGGVSARRGRDRGMRRERNISRFSGRFATDGVSGAKDKRGGFGWSRNEIKGFNNQTLEATRTVTGFAAQIQKGNVVARQMHLGLAGLVTGIQNVIQAASPDAMNTLRISFEFLAASIGRTFIPEIVKVSFTLQRWARQIREGDQELLNFVKNVALAAGAVLALGVALPMAVNAIAAFVHLGSMVWNVIGALGGFRGMLLALGANPALAPMIVLGGAASMVAKKFYDLADAINKNVDDQKNAPGRAAAARENDQEIKEARKRFKGKDDEYEAWLKERETQARNAQAANLRGGGGAGASEDRALEQRRLIYQQEREDLHRKRSGLPKLDRGVGKSGGEGLLDLRNNNQPSYSQLEDVYQRVQLAALQDNPAQAELKRWQDEVRTLLIKTAEASNRTAETIGRVGGATR
jgi:hypothetical protein